MRQIEGYYSCFGDEFLHRFLCWVTHQKEATRWNWITLTTLCEGNTREMCVRWKYTKTIKIDSMIYVIVLVIDIICTSFEFCSFYTLISIQPLFYLFVVALYMLSPVFGLLANLTTICFISGLALFAMSDSTFKRPASPLPESDTKRCRTSSDLPFFSIGCPSTGRAYVLPSCPRNTTFIQKDFGDRVRWAPESLWHWIPNCGLQYQSFGCAFNSSSRGGASLDKILSCLAPSSMQSYAIDESSVTSASEASSSATSDFRAKDGHAAQPASVGSSSVTATSLEDAVSVPVSSNSVRICSQNCCRVVVIVVL